LRRSVLPYLRHAADRHPKPKLVRGVTASGDDGPVITWTPYGIDGGCIGFDRGRRLVAQVVWYDAPEPGWVAFVRHQRLNGRWEVAKDAVDASEAVLSVR
jgi:hypothetical protein